jgi:hypothetical protein
MLDCERNMNGKPHDSVRFRDGEAQHRTGTSVPRTKSAVIHGSFWQSS